MRRALELAERGLFTTTPNPRVGCVIVRDERIIGEGWHERAGEAHAEVAALGRRAGARRSHARGDRLRDAGAVQPPRPHAAVHRGVARRRHRAGGRRHARPEPGVPRRGASVCAQPGSTSSTVCARVEARELNIGWIQRIVDGRPWVRVKIAASLDGKTALDNGTSQWITGSAARADGHRWRARSCAILTGIGTVLQDDPQLTVRAVETSRQPLRVIVDRHGRAAGDGAGARRRRRARRVGGRVAGDVAGPRPPRAAPRTRRPGRPRGAAGASRRARHQRAAGRSRRQLNGALLAAGLIDELLLYLAPSLLGDPARGMFALPTPLSQLAQRVPCTFTTPRASATIGACVARVLPAGRLMFTGIVQAVGRISGAAPRG